MRQQFIILSLVFSLLWPISLFGQVGLPVITSEENFSLASSPANPGANQSVTVTLNGNSQRLGNARITWYLNGAEYLSGIGERNLVFNTGSNGSSANVRAVIRLSNGEVIDKDLIIIPTDIDLIWEAVSYTPPFYQGKGLFAHQSQVKVVAIPHLASGSSEIPKEQLIYQWKRNGENMVSASGYGKNVFQFRNSIISRPSLIELEVTNSSLTRRASASIVINPIEPMILIYENHPLYGLMTNQTIGEAYNLIQKEINVWAAPFYFATETQNSPILAYRWSINGVEAIDQNNKRFVIFRVPDNTAGQSAVTVTINNINSILQFADQEVRFGFDTRENLETFSNL